MSAFDRYSPPKLFINTIKKETADIIKSSIFLNEIFPFIIDITINNPHTIDAERIPVNEAHIMSDIDTNIA